MNLFKEREILKGKVREIEDKIGKEYSLQDTFYFLQEWEEGPSKEVTNYLKRIGGIPECYGVQHSGWHGFSECWWIPRRYVDKDGDFELPEGLEP